MELVTQAPHRLQAQSHKAALTSPNKCGHPGHSCLSAPLTTNSGAPVTTPLGSTIPDRQTHRTQELITYGYQ